MSVRSVAWISAALFLFAARSAGADRPPIEGVEIIERLGESVSRDLLFVDQTGRSVRIGDYLDGGRPLILTLGYYSCPALCGLVLSGLTTALRSSGGVPGRDFEIVTVSIDPGDRPKIARERRVRHLAALGLSHTTAWPFLTGDESSIHSIAEAVGFRYRYDTATQQYAHSAVAIVLTPSGVVARYFYGATFSPRDLRLTLIEAGAERIGTSIDRALLLCYRYDPATRRYGPYLFGTLRASALAVAMLLGALLLRLWRREHGRIG